MRGTPAEVTFNSYLDLNGGFNPQHVIMMGSGDTGWMYFRALLPPMFWYAHLERVKDPRWNTGNTWTDSGAQTHTHTHSSTLIFHLFCFYFNTRNCYLSDKTAENSGWYWIEAQIARYMPSVARNESVTWSLLHHEWGVKKDKGSEDRWSVLQPICDCADIFTTTLGATLSYHICKRLAYWLCMTGIDLWSRTKL